MAVQLFIRTEEKHVQRMAVRAKYMTTDPAKNKYVRNLRNIRSIQDYLSRTADKVAVPKLSNSNLDVSVEAVHRTVVQVLHRCAPAPACRAPLPRHMCRGRTSPPPSRATTTPHCPQSIALTSGQV